MKPIITIICLFGSIALMFFGIWPEYSELREHMELADVKEQDLENFREYHQTIEAMMTNLETDYADELQKMKDGVPDDHYVPSFFAELRRTSYRTGLRIESIGDFTETEFTELPEVEAIEISFSAEGAYPNFKNFISELENSARIISVQNVSMDNAGEGQPLNYSITLLTYSY